MSQFPHVYLTSSQWALVGKKSSTYDHVEFSGDDYKFQVVNYSFTVRRKARWMTVYMMLPCIVVTVLAACVFCLPANSCEKTTLATTVLIITTFFLTILPKVSPQSSMGMPLVSKWLTFSLIITTLEQLVCVYIINLNYRNPSVYDLSWKRRILYLRKMPKFLKMKLPKARQQGVDNLQNTMHKMANGGGAMGMLSLLNKLTLTHMQNIGALPPESMEVVNRLHMHQKYVPKTELKSHLMLEAEHSMRAHGIGTIV